MIGLVIVSHSRALANSLLDLVKQVNVEPIPIAVAAGVGDNRSEFGTDAVEIMDAIQSVFSPEGVLVLMDLGSAVLSSQMALDLLPPEISKKVRFCSAPLVEGCIAASVRIGLGSDIQTVYNEAMQALLPKREQLGDSAEDPVVAVAASAAPAIEFGKEVIYTLKNLHGLHARPVARFIKLASSFNASIQVQNRTNGKGPVSAKSLNALTTLGAVRGHQIALIGSGPEAEQALEALGKMVNEGFGELEEQKESAASGNAAAPITAAEELAIEKGNMKHCIPISEGIAVGPIYLYKPSAAIIPEGKVEDSDKELKRMQVAIDATARAIELRRQKLKATLGEAEAAIFDAHLLILEDPDIQDQVRQLIVGEKANASAAWDQVIQKVAESYRALSDSYLQQRAADVLDVGNQVLYELSEKAGTANIHFEQPVIMFAEDITPTETSQLDMEQVLAIITVGGGPTSHASILARALGIPAISGASMMLGNLRPGTIVAVDGFNGSVWVEPDETVQAKLLDRRKVWLYQKQKLLLTSHELVHLKDGRRVEIAANIGNVADARNAVKNGAEGVGLLRTEFMFLTNQTPPTESDQYEALCQVGEALGDKRTAVIRTLDVGGDKGLPYIQLAPEANPFLGVRAIRLSMMRPDLIITQLRAILRAGATYPFRIMFPMVANLDEVLQARQWVEKVHLDLTTENVPHRWPIETGIMIEIPSAAILSHVLAPHVDFFSIGTNDLTQYTMAAERGNPALANLADAMHPAVLSLIQNVAESAHRFGKWVGVCGELAGDPVAAPILVGLGVDELSMSPGSIPRVKDLLRKIDYKTAQHWAEQALKEESASGVRNMLQGFIAGLE